MPFILVRRSVKSHNPNNRRGSPRIRCTLIHSLLEPHPTTAEVARRGNVVVIAVA